MSARLKIWLKRLGLLLALPVLAVIVAIGYVSVKIATYQQLDDAAHMASKADYLKSIARAAPENALIWWSFCLMIWAMAMSALPAIK